MSDIVLSAAVRNNLLALQNTAQLMDTTQNRLATGKKVNSALDNPTNFFTAAGLDNRASDLNNLLDSVGNAVQTLQAANTGITGLQKLVDTAKATANQALQSPNAYTTKASISSSVSGLSSTDLTQLIQSTAVAATTGAGAQALTFPTDAAATTGAGSVNFSADSAATFTGAADGTVVGADALNNLSTHGGTNFAVGDTITVNGQTLTITTAGTGASDSTHIKADDTVTNLVGKLQAFLQDPTNGAGATSTVAWSDTTHKLTLTASDATKNISVGSTGAAAAAFGVSNTATTYTPTNSALTALAGKSLTVQFGSNASTTLTFGTGSDGKIASTRDLYAQLNAISGISASFATPASGSTPASGALTVKNASSTDYHNGFTLTGSDNTVIAALGLAAGGTTTKTYNATNFVNSNSSLNGTSFTIQVGSQTARTLTFGTGAGQIATYSEFQAAISNAGASLSNDSSNHLIISAGAGNTTQSIKLSGPSSNSALGTGAGTLGLAAGTYNPTGQSLSGTSLIVTTGSAALGTLKTSTLNFGTAAGQLKSLDDVNNQLVKDGVDVQASLDSTGTLTFATTNENARGTFTVSGTAATTAFGAATAFTNLNSSTPVFGGPGDATRRSLASQFNDLLSQIDQLAQDSSFNGVNLLNGDDLTVNFNENGTSKLGIKGVTFNSTGLGLSAVASDGSDFLDGDSINKVVAKLDSASTTLRSQSSAFGSNLGVVQTRQDFTKSLVNVLQTGSANLTLADTNEEAANSTALQTRQQLSISALALSNQAQQAVLRLLQ